MHREDLNIKSKVFIIKYKVIHKQLKQTCPIIRISHTISILLNDVNFNSYICLRCTKKLYNLLCETIFQAFLHVLFIFFAFFTPGKQSYFEISEMTTHRTTHSDPRPRSLMYFRLRQYFRFPGSISFHEPAILGKEREALG
jgi:hypothetical protein